MDLFRAHVLVCGGTGCSSSGSAELIERFEEQIAKNGLDREVKVVRTGCFGLCGFWVTITFRCAAPPPFWQTEI